MTKLDKIEEIIREYENGVDSSIDALDVLEGIKNVLDDPTFTKNEIIRGNDTLRVSSPAGELCAYVGADPNNPSVGIYLMPKDGDGIIFDLSFAEVKGKELTDIEKEKGIDIGYEDVSLYTYADPHLEEFTHENIIKRQDVIEALEINDCEPDKKEKQPEKNRQESRD